MASKGLMCTQHAISFTYDLTLQGKYVISMCKYIQL